MFDFGIEEEVVDLKLPERYDDCLREFATLLGWPCTHDDGRRSHLTHPESGYYVQIKHGDKILPCSARIFQLDHKSGKCGASSTWPDCLRQLLDSAGCHNAQCIDRGDGYIEVVDALRVTLARHPVRNAYAESKGLDLALRWVPEQWREFLDYLLTSPLWALQPAEVYGNGATRAVFVADDTATTATVCQLNHFFGGRYMCLMRGLVDGKQSVRCYGEPSHNAAEVLAAFRRGIISTQPKNRTPAMMEMLEVLGGEVAA